jgi:hypothetical protein
MMLHKIIFNFKGKKPQQSTVQTVEHLSTGDSADTCQSVQQTPPRAQKRQASEKQAQLSPVSFSTHYIYLILIVSLV